MEQSYNAQGLLRVIEGLGVNHPIKNDMKDILMIECLIFVTGFSLWILDDPYIPEAKILGSAYGTKIMKWSFIATCLTALFLK